MRGHTVSVVALADTPRSPWIASFPVKCVCLGPSFLNYSYNFELVRWLLGNASQFDLLVVNGLWQFQSVGGALASAFLGKPYVVYIHGMLGPVGKSSLWKYLKKFVYWTMVEFWVVRKAKFAIFTSEEEARLAKAFFPFYRWAQAVVGNGVARPLPPKPQRVAELFSRFPELTDKTIVLFLGRLHPGKGCDILLRAFAAELSARDRHHLVIVGPSAHAGYTMRLKNLSKSLGIAEKVTWTGMLQGEQKEAIYSIASVYVSPSHGENFGLSIVEALARGIPAIVSNKVNIQGILDAGGAAMICEGTVAGVSGALREWDSMPEAMKVSMRENQLRLYERVFTPERAAEALEQVLSAAVTQHSLEQGGIVS